MINCTVTNVAFRMIVPVSVSHHSSIIAVPVFVSVLHSLSLIAVYSVHIPMRHRLVVLNCQHLLGDLQVRNGFVAKDDVYLHFEAVLISVITNNDPRAWKAHSRCSHTAG
jgi:hypothetical protein